MLSFAPTNDKSLLNTLSNEIFGCDYEGDIGFVLKKEDTSLGLAKIYCTDEKSILLKLGILPLCRHNGFGDFFTRSLLLRMSKVSSKIVINYSSEYFEKFGFTGKEGKMFIDSEKMVFPCNCKKGE